MQCVRREVPVRQLPFDPPLLGQRLGVGRVALEDRHWIPLTRAQQPEDNLRLALLAVPVVPELRRAR